MKFSANAENEIQLVPTYATGIFHNAKRYYTCLQGEFY